MDKIPTPDLSHLTIKDYDEVYEPAEDSFLLLDALEKELSELRDLKPSICLEVGSGSGIVSAALASAVHCFVIAADINGHACISTALTSEQNRVENRIGVVRTSALSGLEERLAGKVDLLVCNPPYVATEEVEAQIGQDCRDLSAAWAGGCVGRGLTDLVINALPLLLSENGRCYMVFEQCNKVDEALSRAKDIGLDARLVIKRRAGRELLSVYSLTRAKHVS